MRLTVTGRVVIADLVLIELAGQQIKSSLGAPVRSSARRLSGVRMVSARGSVKAVKSPLVGIAGQVITMNGE